MLFVWLHMRKRKRSWESKKKNLQNQRGKDISNQISLINYPTHSEPYIWICVINLDLYSNSILKIYLYYTYLLYVLHITSIWYITHIFDVYYTHLPFTLHISSIYITHNFHIYYKYLPYILHTSSICITHIFHMIYYTYLPHVLKISSICITHIFHMIYNTYLPHDLENRDSRHVPLKRFFESSFPSRTLPTGNDTYGYV